MRCFSGISAWRVTRVGDGVDEKLNTPMEGGDRLGWVDRLGGGSVFVCKHDRDHGGRVIAWADDGFEGHRLWGPDLFVLDE